MIPVTKPYIPKLETYQSLLEDCFQRAWLTNNGPLLIKFEEELRKYLDVEKLLVLANGTLALQLAIKALRLQGEIITTPFSYVATTSSIVWEGCKPVFVDIDAKSLNIDPSKIEAAITSNTSAILATHCFGNACDIDAIEVIAQKHGLRVIYDAAHCFGTNYKGKSIFEYGDISTCSLHATKLMHSIEGGLVMTKDANLIDRMAYMRNFGHDGFDKYNGVGINAKNSEVHAAMGLCVLEDLIEILQVRAKQCAYYDQLFKDQYLDKPIPLEDCEPNHAYYPILFSSEAVALRVKTKLEENDIFPRRYFYPSLSSLDYVSNAQNPISDDCASRVLCLPIYHELSSEDQDLIASIVISAL